MHGKERTLPATPLWRRRTVPGADCATKPGSVPTQAVRHPSRYGCGGDRRTLALSKAQPHLASASRHDAVPTACARAGAAPIRCAGGATLQFVEANRKHLDCCPTCPSRACRQPWFGNGTALHTRTPAALARARDSAMPNLRPPTGAPPPATGAKPELCCGLESAAHAGGGGRGGAVDRHARRRRGRAGGPARRRERGRVRRSAADGAAVRAAAPARRAGHAWAARRPRGPALSTRPADRAPPRKVQPPPPRRGRGGGAAPGGAEAPQRVCAGPGGAVARRG